MSKIGNIVSGYLLAFILVVLVVLFFSSTIVPKIGGLIESVAWFKSDDTKNINQEKPTPVQQKREIEGMAKAGRDAIPGMEDIYPNWKKKHFNKLLERLEIEEEKLEK